MKHYTLKAFLVLSVLLFSSYISYSQEPSIDRSQEVIDSIRQEQVLQDKETMDEAKAANREYKEIAKEAQRVEQEAKDASVQSNKALKAEKKAQRARSKADKQAKKASDARVKSDGN
jgi:hypothetical protein